MRPQGLVWLDGDQPDWSTSMGALCSDEETNEIRSLTRVLERSHYILLAYLVSAASAEVFFINVFFCMTDNLYSFVVIVLTMCRYWPGVWATSGRDLRRGVHHTVQGSTSGRLGRPDDCVRVTQARRWSDQGPTTQRLSSVLTHRLSQETLCESIPHDTLR